MLSQLFSLVYEYIAFFYNNLALLKIFFSNSSYEGINFQKKFATGRLDIKISVTGRRFASQDSLNYGLSFTP